MSDVLDEFKTDRELLVHISGIPFTLPAGTCIKGLRSNYELAMQLGAYDAQQCDPSSEQNRSAK